MAARKKRNALVAAAARKPKVRPKESLNPGGTGSAEETMMDTRDYSIRSQRSKKMADQAAKGDQKALQDYRENQGRMADRERAGGAPPNGDPKSRDRDDTQFGPYKREADAFFDKAARKAKKNRDRLQQHRGHGKNDRSL